MSWRTDIPDGAISLGASQGQVDACGLVIDGAHITIRDHEAWERFQRLGPDVAVVNCMIVSTVHGSDRLI